MLMHKVGQKTLQAVDIAAVTHLCLGSELSVYTMSEGTQVLERVVA